MTKTASGDCPLYVINLDRAPDRARHMHESLAAHDLHGRLTRIPALDAMQHRPRSAYAPHRRSIQWRMDVSEFACLESHRRAWLKMIEDGVDRAVILEDDLLFAEGFAPALAAILAAAPRFDCIKLDGLSWHLRLGPETRCGDIGLRPLLQLAISAGAYLLSREGAEKMVAMTETYHDPVDLMLFRPRTGWTQYQATPAICAQGVLLHPEDLDGVPESVAQSQRAEGIALAGPKMESPLWWRLRRDARGMVYRLHNRLWRDRRILRAGGQIAQVGLLGAFARYR